ncbi:DoxX family protein [Curtobacterium sp. 22159]|uniref:DoxX family protein n=1 Tax=Curtobacterium sp. 22159 TaxID=3453882 RepID=UPI003F85D5C5
MRRRERERRATRTAAGLAVVLGGAGVTHFVRPRGYDRIVPDALPPRLTTLASGAAELGIATGLAIPATRRAAGWAAAALFLAVFPANLKMAGDLLDSPRSSRTMRLLSVLRLPLQAPLVAWAVRVGRHAPKR